MLLNVIKIYINNDGTLHKTLDTPFYRLSNSINIMQLISPTSRNNVQRINFLLPNNVSPLAKPMFLLPNKEVVDGEEWNVWEYTVDSATLSLCSAFKSTPLRVNFIESELIWYRGDDEVTVEDENYYGMFKNTTMLSFYRNTVLPQEGNWSIVEFMPNEIVLQEGEVQYYIYKYTNNEWVLQLDATSQPIKANILNKMIKTTATTKLNIQPSLSNTNEEVIISTTDLILQQIVNLNTSLQQLQTNVIGGTGNLHLDEFKIESISTKTTNQVLTEIFNSTIYPTLPLGSRILSPTFTTLDTPFVGRVVIKIIDEDTLSAVVELNSTLDEQKYYLLKNGAVVTEWFRYATGKDTENILSGVSMFTKLSFDIITEIPDEDFEVGETRWNDTYKTLETKLTETVKLLHGQEGVHPVRNGGSDVILNGSVVYVSGAIGGSHHVVVRRADNTDYSTATSIIGVATEDIAYPNGTGFVCFVGGVTFEPNHFALEDVGKKVYLGEYGLLTTVKPTPPRAIIQVGVIENTHRILVSPRIHLKLSDASDVITTNRQNLDTLVWNATLQVYESKPTAKTYVFSDTEPEDETVDLWFKILQV
jgi:hypothetical protein